MPIRCLIFDCDGTLVDSEGLSAAVLSRMAQEYGFPVSVAEAGLLFKGAKLADGVAALEARFQSVLPASFIADFRLRSAEAFRRHLKPMPHVAAALESLDLPKCVASSAPREKVEANLRLTGLARHFRHIFSSYDIDSWKPEPDLFLHAAAHMQTAPRDCLVVEDSDGIRAGLGADMRVAAYRRSDFADEGILHFDDYRKFAEILSLP